MSVGVPIKLLHEAEGNKILLELTTGEKYSGLLKSAEDTMNCLLSDVTMRARDGKKSKLESVYIRGSIIRYVVLPNILKNSPMFDKIHKMKIEKEERDKKKNNKN